MRPRAWLDELGRDLLHGARRLRRQPGSTLAAAGTLALGLGAAITLFGLVNGLFLKPLPGVAQQDRLIKVLPAAPEQALAGFSRDEHAALRDGQDVLGGLAAFRGVLAGVRAADHRAETETEPEATGELLLVQEVSAEYFSVLGTDFSDSAGGGRGRPILQDDTVGAGRPVAVISERLRRRTFPEGTNPLGRTVTVRGEPHTVVGVAPPGFGGTFVGFVADLWLPLPEVGDGGGIDGLELVGRLAPGVSRERATAALTALGDHLSRSDRPEETLAVRVVPETGFDESLEGAVAAFSIFLLVVALLVLGVACFNVANLLLARATERRREMSVRAALGAGRRRLVRQLLTESLLLAVAAALGGWGFAAMGLRGLERFSPRLGEITLHLDLSPDVRVLGFTVAVALATTWGATLLPALRAAQPGRLAALRGGTRGGGRTSRTVSGLLVAQVAVTVVLLAATSLFVRALQQAGTQDLGFHAERVLTVTLRTPDGEPADEATQRLHHRLEESLAALPGVRAASRVVGLPLAPRLAGRATVPVTLDGVPAPPGEEAWRVETGRAAPGYFDVMGISRLHGRDFLPADDPSAPAVVVVNRAFADTFFPNADAGSLPGREIEVRDGSATIVGVVENSKTGSLDETARPYLYRAVDQEASRTVTFVLRTVGDPAAPVLQVRRLLREEAPAQLVLQLAPMTEVIRGALLPQRWAAAVSGLLGALALLLAVVGVAAMLTYTVSRRRREIGIRLALGADREDVLRQVLGTGLRLTAWGLALGLAMALGATRLLSSFLVGVSPADPAAYLGVVAVLTLAVLPALWLPARRALGIQPRTVLSSE